MFAKGNTPWLNGEKSFGVIRPIVRGLVMSPCDHRHGGEDKSPIDNSGSVTPWGKLAPGHKTRSKKKANAKKP